MVLDDRQSGLRHLLLVPDWTAERPEADAALRDDCRAGNVRLRPDLGDGANPGRDLRGPPLWQHLRYGNGCGDPGRSGGVRGWRAGFFGYRVRLRLLFLAGMGQAVLAARLLSCPPPRAWGCVRGATRGGV